MNNTEKEVNRCSADDSSPDNLSKILHPSIGSSTPSAPPPPRIITTGTSIDKQFSQQILMPRLPSTDSLNYSTGPGSPGVSNDSPKCDSTFDKNAIKLSRKESYKAQRKNYRKEKKRVANEVATSLKDPSVVVLADWLKVRGTLKSWTKLWCILKPGLLLLYKSPKVKSNHWVGTVLLNACQVIERPSKKDGFCFKLFHPLDQSIWAPRGPEKETIGAVVQPLPTSYLIFRAPSQAAGKCWLDALELALRTSSVLVRSMSNKSGCESTNHETQWSEADYEKHFDDHDLNDGNQTDNGNMAETLSAVEVSDSESENSVKNEDEERTVNNEDEIEEKILETPYVSDPESDINVQSGIHTEQLAEEHKSLIWYVVKQVRPGMDLSKVVLPTFILEPRSFLDKLSDAYYHADILSLAVLEDDPYDRLKLVVKWYLSGFYKKPKGLKKPYNPILGELFRCYWQHPNGSRTFYVAEQVSHHPPISAFYVTNRQDGFSISCSILAKSKFYGNSTSAILDGIATLTLLPRGENYTMNVPYANCRGILMGTLCMELGGKVLIECEKTGYNAELEFRLKSVFGNSDYNIVSGRLNLGKECLATIEGHWDGKLKIKDLKTNVERVLFEPTSEVRQSRLVRYLVPIEHQTDFESQKLWRKVSAAILRNDQVSATEEKTILEEAQRTSARERQITGEEWTPTYFQLDPVMNTWLYRAADSRPWDKHTDLFQYEYQFLICTKTRNKSLTLTRHTAANKTKSSTNGRGTIIKPPPRRPKLQKQSKSGSSEVRESSSEENEYQVDSTANRKPRIKEEFAEILDCLHNLESNIKEQSEQFTNLKITFANIDQSNQMFKIKTNGALKRLQDRENNRSSHGYFTLSVLDICFIVSITLIINSFLCWIFEYYTQNILKKNN